MIKINHKSNNKNIKDFTHKHYRDILTIAKKNYRFYDYTNSYKVNNFLIWRHDIDLSVHSAFNLALIENKYKIKATYFINIHSEFYNVFEKEIFDKLTQILKLGHSFGIHYDSEFYKSKTEKELIRNLKTEKQILEKYFNTKISAFSFHNPTTTDLKFDKKSYAGLINTYSKFFKEEVGYCSDSNGYWRYERLVDVLKSKKYQKLQVLTHDAWWQKNAIPPRDRVLRCIKGRSEKVIKKYDSTLKKFGRLNIQ